MNKVIEALRVRLETFLSNSILRMVSILLLGVLVGAFFFSNDSAMPEDAHTDHDGATSWTCSMHPQIKLDEPGQCPICFMDLIPLTNSQGMDRPNQYSMSPTAAKLAEILTTPVRRGLAVGEIRLSGKINYDETSIKTISAWFPGRLERLFVDYTGIPVRRGDHLFEIYSPSLYSAQEELLSAYRRNAVTNSSNNKVRNEAFQAVRAKTKLLGLSETQIEEIIAEGEPRAALQINSPISGIVTHKNASEGQYVKTGEQIYVISDLSKVWITLDAYEKDLNWLTYGQDIEFTVAGISAKKFSAKISYIDPLVDSKTRSVTVRAVLDNPDGLLKPGMLAEATITVHLNSKGSVISEDYSGMWVCPMHPEVLETHSGACRVCGMDLVPASQDAMNHAVATESLLIPVSAVLKTGKRALVYVEVSNDEMITYEIREVITGPRVDDEIIVISGLSVGEKVVSNGNFKIDSAMQIAGKQSMMSATKASNTQEVSGENAALLSTIYSGYLKLQSNLAGDDLPGSRQTFEILMSSIAAMGRNTSSMPDGWELNWKKFENQVVPTFELKSITDMRADFEHASEFVLTLQKEYGHTDTEMLYEVFCPMAFNNKGASWLQTDKQVRNPYFGAQMLSCGEVKQTYSPRVAHHE